MGSPTTGPCRIVALHGFLGHTDDWIPLRRRLPGVWWSPLDLWDIIRPAGVRDWTSVGSAIDRAIRAAADASPRLPAVTLGYSFGARLLLAAPGAASHVMGTCFASCNPGLAATDDAGREARRVSDESWVRRLLDSDPPALYDAWNTQPVLASSAPMAAREELPADRETLAKAMRVLSVAGQPDWDGRLRGWPGPALMVAGERDAKYAAIARGFERASRNLDVSIVSGAGHRVPWDNPEEFVEVFAAWVNGLISRSRA